MATEQEFQDAANKVSGLKNVPCAGLRLALWMLYKQATYGDYRPEKLGEIEPKYREDDELFKRNGWGTLTDMSKDHARIYYVELANFVVKNHS